MGILRRFNIVLLGLATSQTLSCQVAMKANGVLQAVPACANRGNLPLGDSGSSSH